MKVPLTIGDFLRRGAAVYADRPAVVDEPGTQGSLGTLSYRQLASRARGMALALDDLGVAHDKMVIGEVVTAAIERALPRARLRSGTIEMTGADGAQAVGDTALVSRVLDNLLANVRAHTPEGTATSVTVARVGDGAEIVVRDSGPGMPSDDAARACPPARSTAGTASTNRWSSIYSASRWRHRPCR